MPGQGGGPSRRSHTKSRKGCKTCKRRHIRCDETFPQCRNCTKHQVRCDYLDDAAQHQDSHAGSSVNSPSVPLSALPWNSEIETLVDRWQQSGEASLGDLSIDLSTHGYAYTRSDLHLMYFMLLSGQSAESAQYTVWNATNVHAFAAAKYRPFLAHAMLALSALSLAWEYDSIDVKSLAYHHGAIALQGLQEAIANYSEENGDAILLASLLLSWQANDWRSWVSLTSGIRTLVSNMRPYKSRSMIPHIIDEQILAIPESFPSQSSFTSSDEYRSTLRQVYGALDTLQPYISGRREAVWIDQIKDYVDRLLGAQAPATPDEQFNYLYVFRKYLFWVPSMALKSHAKDMMTLIVLAHLFSTALQLEPLFPDVAPAFCTRLAARPLEEILETFNALRERGTSHGQQMATMSFLLSHPQSVVAQHHARVATSFNLPQIQSTPPPQQSESNIVTTDLAYSIEAFGIPGQRSPAFGPMPTHHRGSTDTSPSYGSPYLEVPRGVSGVWSPTATLRSSHGSEVSHEPYMGGPETGYDVSGGFVAPQLLWT